MYFQPITSDVAGIAVICISCRFKSVAILDVERQQFSFKEQESLHLEVGGVVMSKVTSF